MPTTSIAAPAVGEFAPYYGTYINLIPEGTVLETMDRQHDTTLALLRGIRDEQAEFRYAPGKWTVKEVVGHVVDFERIFAYRALRIARGDRTPIPGADENEYVRGANFGARTLFDLAAEFHHLRQANLLLFRSFDEAALHRRGIANGLEISVRALAYIIAGHERHHMTILREKYLA